MQFNAHIARKNTPVPTVPARNETDLQSYFEYAKNGIDVVEEGLTEVTFGELSDRSLLQ